MMDTNLTLLRNKVQIGNRLPVEFMMNKPFIKKLLLTPCISFVSVYIRNL